MKPSVTLLVGKKSYMHVKCFYFYFQDLWKRDSRRKLAIYHNPSEDEVPRGLS